MTEAQPSDVGLMAVAVKAAHAAGQEIAERLGRERDVRVKGLRDLVTDADLAAQEVLLSAIRAHFPSHTILSEEAPGGGTPSGTTWVLDPLDGTSNYAHRFPCFSVSIGVMDDDGPLAGVVYDPLREHLFTAERGRGASLNGEPVHVSAIADPMDAIVGLDFARDPDARRELMGRLSALAPHVHTFRSIGSAALGLCYVAAGWLDGYFHVSLAPWDSAAGVLMVSEAGGTVTDLGGGPWAFGLPRCMAANRRLHAQLLRLPGLAQAAV
jgi:myo-inositol-1(or 4)-monophosphatase